MDDVGIFGHLVAHDFGNLHIWPNLTTSYPVRIGKRWRPVTHPGMSLGECWRQLKFLRELQA